MFVLAQLTSKLIGYYFRYKANEFDALFPKIKIGEYKKLPVKIITKNQQQPYIKKADLMLSLNKQKHEKINNFLHRLETNFEIENFSNKMKAFFDFDFKTLISELKKKKVKLSFSQQDEFEEYFNNYKNEINELQKQIDKTDKEIDQMVYELYGLTKEEVEIVERG